MCQHGQNIIIIPKLKDRDDFLTLGAFERFSPSNKNF